MRILITVDPEIPVPPKTYGGIERIVDWLVRELIKRGHEVALLANCNSTCKASRNFSWSITSSRLFPDGLKAVKELSQLISNFQPDVIHSFSRLFYLLSAYFTNIPVLMSYQRYPTARCVKLAAQLFGKRIMFSGCSKFIVEEGSRAGGNWCCVYNGVELTKYNFISRVITDAPLVFLSRIEPVKGAHVAINIARSSKRKLLIAGNYPEAGPGFAYWNEEIKPQIDGELVEYVGAVDDSLKNKLLGEALALLVPVQWDEPFGIVFVESMACGTPVISTPRGALPEIVLNGQNGFLINDINEGVDAVKKVAYIQREFCRKIIEEKFSSKVLVLEYEKLYQALLQKNRS